VCHHVKLKTIWSSGLGKIKVLGRNKFSSITCLYFWLLQVLLNYVYANKNHFTLH
jgi:hypothetical protein